MRWPKVSLFRQIVIVHGTSGKVSFQSRGSSGMSLMILLRSEYALWAWIIRNKLANGARCPEHTTYFNLLMNGVGSRWSYAPHASNHRQLKVMPKPHKNIHMDQENNHLGWDCSGTMPAAMHIQMKEARMSPSITRIREQVRRKTGPHNCSGRSILQAVSIKAHSTAQSPKNGSIFPLRSYTTTTMEATQRGWVL
jgi:hypothetical protein